MTGTATVPVSLLIEAAECVQRIANLGEECAYSNGEWRSPEDQAEYERLSALAERLRAAADQRDKAEIWRG